jgi:L-ribulose-5-phosphate 4-epimerase
MSPEIISALRKELTFYCKWAFDRKLVRGTGGNLSVRLPGTDTVLITPTGISLGEVVPEDNLLVRLDGEIVESPKGLKGSKETGFHLAAYRERPDAGAIVHLHPPYATSFSNFGKPLPLVTVTARGGLGEVPCLPCALAGSRDLCDFVTEGIKLHPGIKALLMKEHGILTIAPDLRSAFFLADLVEDSAEVAFLAYQWERAGWAAC